MQPAWDKFRILSDIRTRVVKKSNAYREYTAAGNNGPSTTSRKAKWLHWFSTLCQFGSDVSAMGDAQKFLMRLCKVTVKSIITGTRTGRYQFTHASKR